MLTVLLLFAAAPPMTGEIVEPLAALDDIVVEAMGELGATAASLAVFHDDWRHDADAGRKQLARRAYGWSDSRRTKPTTPENTFRLASNTKPFTAATIYRLSETDRLDLDSSVLSKLGDRLMRRKLTDDRWEWITARHLLEHRGGFDRAVSFDPMYRLDRIQRELRLRSTPQPEHVIAYMMSRPLDFAPDERRAYANFGYVVLGQVIAEVTGLATEKAIQELTAEPLGIRDLAVSNHSSRRRPKLEVDYPVASNRPMRVRVASGGMTASPTSLCRLMAARYVTGRRRPPRDATSYYYHYGSLPDTTLCLMVQRRDGLDWALAFNRRNNATFNEDLDTIHTSVRRVLDAYIASTDANSALSQQRAD